jgi:type I restriction enzyme S subunit
MRFPCEQLSDVCEIIMGQAPAGDAYNVKEEGYPLVAGAGDFGPLYPSVKKHTTEASKLSRAGDIILGIRASIGSKVLSDKEYCLGRGVAGLRASHRLDNRYLWHWLEEVRMELLSKGRGATFLQVNRQDIRELQIPLPPLAEQKRIAAILDAADALRTKRREALAQLDALLQSTFLTLFGDPVANPMGWPLQSLKELGKVKTGGTPPSAKTGMFDGPIPFITPGDLGSGRPAKRSVTEAGAAEAEIVRAGATFVCCIGATIGKMGKAEVRSSFNQQINAVEWSKNIDDEYGLGALTFFKARIAKAGASTTLPILKKSSFEKITIPRPPLPLQQKFAAIVESVERQKAVQRAHLAALDALFAALQHRAFRGEL